MLQANNVTKFYGKLRANHDISFQVKEGSIAILLGPNGAGKSTLIKCICGLLRFKGEILIDNLENKSSEAKALLGYVPEMPAVYDLLTVEEHLEFISKAYKVEDKQYEKELLERFELWDKKNKLGKELSKGMQQKLSICCALVHRPRVLVLDEPLVGLDPQAIKQLKKMFLELRDAGCTLLISTHMIDSVEDYWDVSYIMMDGEIAARVENGKDKEGSQESLESIFFEITDKKNKVGNEDEK